MPTINDEINGLIEQKRTQTLELLRDKEAPKANTELASSLDLIEELTESGTPVERCPPSQASHYENVGGNLEEAQDPSAIEGELQAGQSSIANKSQDDDDQVLSPSDSSHNLNTLSLASEILDLSNREENSLVQQLGRT